MLSREEEGVVMVRWAIRGNSTVSMLCASNRQEQASPPPGGRAFSAEGSVAKNPGMIVKELRKYSSEGVGLNSCGATL